MNRKRSRQGAGAEEVIRRAEQGQYRPFYLLYGEEDFERDQASLRLLQALRPQSAPDFNVSLFRGEGLALLDFLQVYQSYPLMAGHRLLVLREAERLTGENCQGLERVVERPVETSLLLVVGGKLDMRRGFFQKLARLGEAVEFRVPYDNQISQWLERQARRQGLEVEREALDLLHLYGGANLRELAGELEKLATYAGEGRRITRSDVEQVAGGAGRVSVFALADAIGQRHYPRAQRLLRRFLDQGEEPGRALAMMVRHLRLLLKTQALLRERVPREKMAARLGVSPFFLGSYVEQSQRHKAENLWAGLGALLEADGRLKTLGRAQEELVMELLLHGLCTGENRVDSD